MRRRVVTEVRVVNPEGSGRERVLLAAGGLLLLALGVVHYLWARSPTALALWPAGLATPPGSLALPALAGGALPTFLHTAAFALLSAAALRGRATLPAAALAWAALNAAFELGQHARAAAAIHGRIGDIGSLAPLVAYFRYGTFDPFDLAAAAAALVACLAVAVLRFPPRQRRSRP